MNREKFTVEKRKLFFLMAVYGLVCEVFSLFVLGFDRGFLAGIILGIGAVTINFIVLEKVMDIVIYREKTFLAFPLHLGRFFLYGALGYISFRIGVTGLIAYGVGMIALPAAAVITYIGEGRQNRID